MRRAICIASLLALTLIGQLAAEDSILGLPAPRDPQRPGAVVLHGGGRITQDVFDRFVALAGGKQARIVFVPSAGWRHSDFPSEDAFLARMKSRFSSWVALAPDRQIASFQFLYTDSPESANDPAFVAPLETATGVWFSGGAQSRLNYRFVGQFPDQTRFQRALRGVLERGGAVGGTSAGTAAIPEIMTVSEGRETPFAPAQAVSAHGLGLFRRAIVEQHFDARGGRLERFTGLLRDDVRLDQLAGRAGAGREMLGLAVEERAALVVRENRLEVLGAANVHVFVKGSSGRTLSWHELRPGERGDLAVEQHGALRLTTK